MFLFPKTLEIENSVIFFLFWEVQVLGCMRLLNEMIPTGFQGSLIEVATGCHVLNY